MQFFFGEGETFPVGAVHHQDDDLKDAHNWMSERQPNQQFKTSAEDLYTVNDDSWWKVKLCR